MDHQERKLLHKIYEILLENERILKAVLALLTRLPTGGTISMIGENGNMPTNLSLVPGVAGIFQFNPTPAGSSVPPADTCTFAANDPAVVIAPVPGQPLQASVTFPATGDSATSFQLAAQVSGPDFPTPVNATPVTVSIVGSVSGNLPTGGTLSQLS